MEGLFPTLFSVLSQMIKLNNYPEKKKHVLGLIYAMVLCSQCKEMSLIQGVNTVLLSEGDANQEEKGEFLIEITNLF